MADAAPTHKPERQEISETIYSSDSLSSEPLPSSSARDAEEMSPTNPDTQAAFQTGAQAEGMLLQKRAATILGLTPAEADINPPTETIWWADDVSPAAKLIGVWLAGQACPLNGEAIVLAYDARYFGNFADDAALREAVGELVEAGTLEYCWLYRDRLYARFVINDDDFYGTDETLPPDWEYPAMEGVSWEFDREIDQAQRPPTKCKRRTRIYDKTEGKCFYCGETWAEHLDHMHPKSRDGGDHDDNLIGACSSCNSAKRDRTVEEYRALLAYQRRLPDIRMVRFYGEPWQ
jgi:hypothetical protein